MRPQRRVNFPYYVSLIHKQGRSGLMVRLKSLRLKILGSIPSSCKAPVAQSVIEQTNHCELLCAGSNPVRGIGKVPVSPIIRLEFGYQVVSCNCKLQQTAQNSPLASMRGVLYYKLRVS